MSSFGSLYTVRSGLLGARRAMDLVGQNVANANTVGYSRQEASFVAHAPNHVINQPGRGIRQVNAMRYRDDFLDRQYRARMGGLGYQDSRSQALQQLEHVLGGLNETGLRNSMDAFFNAWDTLALNPSHATGRLMVITTANQFLGLAQNAHNELMRLRSDLDEAMRHKVDEINSAAHQIADLNKKILTSVQSGQEPHDLMDRRDMLIDALAQLAGATTTRHDDGQVSIHIGAMMLVSKSHVTEIGYNMLPEADRDADPALISTQQVLASFYWKETGPPPMPATFTTGEMGGLVEMRDSTIPEYMKYLDNLVRTLAEQVNTVYSAGIPAANQEDFFIIGNQWLDVQVNPALAADPSRINVADSWPAAPHDGGRAQKLADLRDALTFTGQPVGGRLVTAAEYLRSIVTSAGLKAQDAIRLGDNAALQVTQAEYMRQSVMGVSLDDEMTKMVQYQQAYNASARMMTTLDEMLDMVISRMGVVGR